MKRLLLLLTLLPFLSFSQIQIGQNINGEAVDDESGFSVSLSSDGDIIAIGAPYNSENGIASGHVRIYKKQSVAWTQLGSDINGISAGDHSGWSVSLSSNGSIVAIGAPRNEFNLGYVRIYENQLGIWTQIGQDISGEAINDESGWSVSLSSDGNIVAIGAVKNSGNGNRSGHVRIYENQSNVWTQIGEDIDGEAELNWLGYSLDLSSDGSIVATGAIFNNENGIHSGHVRIYENQSGVWTQIGEDIDGEAAGDFFGRSLSLSSDGNIIAIGATQNDGNGNNSGHTRIYENQSGVWTQLGSDIEGESDVDLLGYSVSLSADGSIIAIGAPFNDENGNDSGQVRIYKNQSGEWTPIGLNIVGESTNDFLGGSVSLSSDGSILAIGAQGNSENGSLSGHVRVYDLTNVLSVDEFNKPVFQLYPNPTKNQLKIQLENTTELKNVTIYNNIGQQVLTSKNLVVDTSNLTSGLYLVEIETNNGKGSKKLIIE